MKSVMSNFTSQDLEVHRRGGLLALHTDTRLLLPTTFALPGIGLELLEPARATISV